MTPHVRRAVLVLAFAAGCQPAPSMFGPGLDLQLRVSDAQLQQGSVAADQGGPTVSQVLRPQPLVRRGESTVQLSVPVLAALGGVAFLSEAVSLRLILSSILILGGVGLAIGGRRRPA